MTDNVYPLWEWAVYRRDDLLGTFPTEAEARKWSRSRLTNCTVEYIGLDEEGEAEDD